MADRANTGVITGSPPCLSSAGRKARRSNHATYVWVRPDDHKNKRCRTPRRGKMKKIFAGLNEKNLKFHLESMAREKQIPGSYRVVTDKYVSGPVSNAALRAAREYKRDQEATAIAAGVAPDVWKAASAGKTGLALSQVLPCLAELETRGLISLLVNGETDTRGVSRERAVREIFKKYFPINKGDSPKVKFSMMNREVNCRAFASAFSKNSTEPLKEVDKLFRPPEKVNPPAGGGYKNCPVIKGVK